ncbi:MAG: hypothetical protein KDK06_05150, partial [Gammaproteobacteria bacterium]|nr:hypothetical protein [Gammaproteobacteria bacterium]
MLDETQVNIFSAGEQIAPVVTVLGDGTYVVVWQSNAQDGSGYGIFAQRFSADGQRIGVELQVNAFPVGNQTEPAVSQLDDGGWVVTWTDTAGLDGSGQGVFQQRYAADGSTVGVQTLVNTSTSSAQNGSAVTGLASGGWVVTWNNASDTYAQIYDAAGVAVGTEFRVNTTLGNSQYDASVAALSGGGFVVTWSDDNGTDGNGTGVFMQRFNDAGVAQGVETRVNVEVSSTQDDSAVVGLTGGGYVVVWTSVTSGTAGDGRSYGVFARVYDAAGVAQTGEIPVNVETSSDQWQPAVTATADGGFTVVWSSWTSAGAGDGNAYGIIARSFDASGAALGGETVVNQEISGYQTNPSVAAFADGRWVAVWESATSGTAGDGSGSGVFQRQFGDPGLFSPNQAPELEALPTTLDFAENLVNGAPQRLVPNGAVALSDADSSDFDGGNLIVHRLTGFGSQDQFGLDTAQQEQLGVRNEGNGAGQIGVSGASVSFGGVVFGTIASDGANGADLVITFNAQASVAAVEALVENLTYANTSDDPVESRQYTVQVSDGDGGTSTPVVVTVNVMPEADGAVPVFGETQVNSYVPDNQIEPAMAALSDGGWVTVWRSEGQDGAVAGVFGQRYDANGVAVGPEFLVNTNTTNDQYQPAVTGLTGGGFVVTWTDDSGLDGSGLGIFGQRYDATGAAVGGEFQVNTSSSSTQSESSVAALSDGGFVVAWTDYFTNYDGSGAGIAGQRYDAAGNAVGSEFVVNTGNTTGNQVTPQVVGLAGGGFVATWTDQSGSTAPGWESFARVFDAGGNGLADAFRVNTTTASSQYNPSVGALAGGGFVIAWRDDGARDGSGEAVYAQMFSATGVLQGGEFRVNETTPNSQFDPQVVGLDTGGFVIVWEDNNGTDGSGSGVFGQQYDALGNRVDGEFQVNTEFSSTQDQATLAALPGGNFVVGWRSLTSGTAGDGSGYGIFQQVFGDPADFNLQAAPVLEGLNTSVSYAEDAVNAAPALLDANGTVALSDADSADFDGGTLLVSRLTAPQGLVQQFQAPDDLSQDQLGIRNQGTGAGQIGVSGANVTFAGVVIGTLVQDGVDGAALEVTLNANATATAVEALIENLTYANTSDDPVASRTFRVQVSDGDGGSSAAQVVTVNVTPDVDGAVRVFGETQVNSFNTGDQYYPALASLNDGGWISVWRSEGQDGSVAGVFGQRYA